MVGRVKSTLTGSSALEILGKELKQAGLHPDEAEGVISSWQAHHIVPSEASKLPEAVKASDLMIDHFEIDINSAANGVWLPKVKGEIFYSTNDCENVVVNLATHNGKHTNTYFKYVYDKLEDAYETFGPNGLNYNDIALQNEGIKVLQSIRKELIEGKIALGRVQKKFGGRQRKSGNGVTKAIIMTHLLFQIKMNLINTLIQILMVCS